MYGQKKSEQHDVEQKGLVTLAAYLAIKAANAGVRSAKAGIKESNARKRLEQAPIDEKSGLPLKLIETTPEQDCKLVNPGFSNFSADTKNNCVYCSTAFELRRRGFEVTASKSVRGIPASSYAKWWKGAEFTAKHGMRWPDSYTHNETGKELINWAKTEMLKDGEGARGYFAVAWRSGGAHSLAYEVKNNNVTIYDAQAGKIRTIDYYAKHICDLEYARLDNKEPDYELMRKDGVIK